MCHFWSDLHDGIGVVLLGEDVLSQSASRGKCFPA